ncbi:MAG TPA: serine hydrolase [Candidatus Cybelea sp.]|nr:serine hydrolase [Candidatus Cybelea sp.]
MRAIISAALALAMLLLVAPTAVAQSPAPAQSANDLARSRIDTMLRTGHADASWFSAGFLAQVSVAEVDAVIAGLMDKLGAYHSVEFTPTKFIARFAKGTDDVLIHIDADMRIDGLLFKAPEIAASSLDDALTTLRHVTGTVSYVIAEKGRPDPAALNPSEVLAVGSTFKLAVLNALLDEVTSGSRHWNDVVPLAARWKSLPSGVLQTWPAGTPLTLATYAAEMISISDNTAADALLRIVGPTALKRYAGSNEPFLTTREMFILKSDEGASMGGMYLTVDSATGRAEVLRRVDALPLPGIEQLMNAPNLAIEYHYSVRDLCKLMERVASLPLMSINPGAADAADFNHVAYKGGSDIGVINMTTMVTTHRGTKLCFSATANDSARGVNETAFGAAYGAALRYLKEF